MGIEQILEIYNQFEQNDICKIFPNDHFGFYQLTVEQPLRTESGKLSLKKGEKQADGKKRDTENVPLGTDVKAYFENEILPHIDSESWIDYSKTRIGYEINFSKYFYKYQALERSEVIREDILASEKVILELMKELFGE